MTDDAQLRVGVILDTEHPQVDLTEGRLGEQLLDLAVAGMLEAHSRAEGPDGTRWPALAKSTVKRKKHAVIGLATGKSHITDPATYSTAPREIGPREAWWIFPQSPEKRWKQAHGWQHGVDRNHMPPRPLIGWTAQAQDRAEATVRAADFAARE